ncbi:hypothetical protein MMC20_000011 [Loxospora ochrophaea]|nr:hypothetical protein [Loxospora ochrophaea]
MSPSTTSTPPRPTLRSPATFSPITTSSPLSSPSRTSTSTSTTSSTASSPTTSHSPRSFASLIHIHHSHSSSSSRPHIRHLRTSSSSTTHTSHHRSRSQKRYSGTTMQCGRHGNEWLFGGWSFTEVVKGLLNPATEKDLNDKEAEKTKRRSWTD